MEFYKPVIPVSSDPTKPLTITTFTFTIYEPGAGEETESFRETDARAALCPDACFPKAFCFLSGMRRQPQSERAKGP